MEFGKKPFISEAAVQAVLDTLVFSTSQKTDIISLQYLFLVEEKLIDPKTPSSEKQRLYIIQLVLIDIITSQLKYLRSRFQRDINDDETYNEAIQSLTADVQSQSNELTSWSILYYLYVQVDLGFTLEGIATVIGVVSRTLRRYRTHGVKLLTQKLWEQEAICRRDYHYKGIYHQLQPWAVEPFLGREQEINYVVQNLANNRAKVVYVHGATGIGKTAFIQQAIIKLLDQQSVDDLLWISNLQVSDIKRFRYHFVANDPNVSLEAVFRTFNCIIVLDGVDVLLKSADFENILDKLQGAIIFFSTTIYYPVRQSIINIPLNKLDNHLSEALIRSCFNHDVPADTVRHIHSLADGNPRQINYIASYHQYALSTDSIVNFIGGLKLEHRVLMLFISPHDGLLIEDIRKICGTLDLTDSDIEFLLNLKLVIQSQNRIYSQLVHDILADSLTEISTHIIKVLNETSIFSEPWIVSTHILTTYSQYMDDETLISLISQFWRIGIKYGDKMKWHSILLDTTAAFDELGLLIAKAVSHKEMNELHIAESILLDLINLSGLKGDFAIQADASLELVKIYRLKSEYQRAIDHLTTLNSSLTQYLKSQQYNAFILEQAQLALDMSQFEYAATLVAPLSSLEASLIEAEALYRLQDLSSCLKLCHEMLSEHNLSTTIKGIIHNLMGRCYQGVDYNLAVEEFDLAIEYFRGSFNIRNLSHAEINLSTTFIYQEEVEKAIQTLSHAEELCKITQDHIGMKIIQKNKSYIHHLIVSKY